MSQIETFLQLFQEIDFKVNKTKTKDIPISREMNLSAEDELKRMLDRAKRDLNRATKLYKRKKISSEELMEWEWRVHELQEEIKKMRDLDNELDDFEDLDLY